MKHAEVVIARRAIEEGRGLVVIVNKMDLFRGKENSAVYNSIIEAVPKEIQSVNPQVSLFILSVALNIATILASASSYGG